MANARTESAGILYVVATPIGNLADLSPRARDVLGAVDLVAAEDTRRAGKLMQHLGLDQQLVSLHEHNEDAQVPKLLAQLEAGRTIALISDAGTPLISDPGLRLVASAQAAGNRVVSIPGPSAVTAALSISGLATDRFVFEGFLPRKSRRRRDRIEALRTESRTLVLFESVHRVEATVADLVEVLGAERRAAVGRELTKLHEQVVTATLGEIEAALGDSVPLLGEFVLVVAGADMQPAVGAEEIQRIYRLLAEELPPARAAALCAKITGRARSEVYSLTR
ncbi:MAG: 16S rRNA (cytidine(1402)-2'-O)-methyltransferase [Gammaproteobacteria bacterium]